ncbi:Hypothetical protein KNT65_gp004 [Escherichia phage EcS1]|uniref:Uncharacterized protein n=1 Tax=Escherichia phage EcS1 TaxID=2083276 RepID=A0A2Z5ZCE0_9CAUD|nr:Hypothetical protein KNT65_gp004 [Escherichia phage EcS1]BBC78052.1 Hypothetical protein [Escherichia phage EcS1]
MYRWWITLVDGSYGYLWADNQPLTGDLVTITVTKADGSRVKVTGQVSRVD